MNNELMINQNTDIMAADGPGMYMSFECSDVGSKIALYNAINSVDQKVSDYINKNIMLKDVVCVPAQLVNEETGEATEAVRSILFDDAGITYACSSSGIFNSLKNIKRIFGTLHFDEPLKVQVAQVSTKKGSTLTLRVGV